MQSPLSIPLRVSIHRQPTGQLWFHCASIGGSASTFISLPGMSQTLEMRRVSIMAFSGEVSLLILGFLGGSGRPSNSLPEDASEEAVVASVVLEIEERSNYLRVVIAGLSDALVIESVRYSGDAERKQAVELFVHAIQAHLFKSWFYFDVDRWEMRDGKWALMGYPEDGRTEPLKY